MSTKADFYVGRGEGAEWIGSLAENGYPENLPNAVRTATTEANYRAAVSAFFASRADAVLPNQKWPWLWKDSSTTDHAYAFDAGAVWASYFGHAWFNAAPPNLEVHTTGPKVAIFPDMTAHFRRSPDS